MSEEDDEVVLMKAFLSRHFGLKTIYQVVVWVVKEQQLMNSVSQSIPAELAADGRAAHLTISSITGSTSTPDITNVKSDLSPRMARYLRRNWGSPFVLAFIVLLIAAAVELSLGQQRLANDIAIDSFYALVLGIALQIAASVKYGDGESKLAPPKPSVRRAKSRWTLRRGTTALVIAAIFAVVLIVYFAPPETPIGSLTPTSVSTCQPNGSDGTIFITATTNVSIEICGSSYAVTAGSGGGLTYSYHAGRTTFKAPASVDGSRFEYWYAIVGNSPPTKVTNTTLTLVLPPGLDAQSSLIELTYSSAQGSASSTKTDANATSSSVRT